LRGALGIVLAAEDPSSFGFAQPEWGIIEKIFANKCGRNKLQRVCNVGKAKALYEFQKDTAISFKHYSISSALTLPNNVRLKFWSDLIAVVDGRPILPFFDLRSKNGLDTERAMQIAMSIQKEVAIAQDADLLNSGVESGIIQVLGSIKSGFVVEAIISPPPRLLTLEEIEEVVLEVWDDVVRVNQEDSGSQKGTGTAGR